MGEPSAPLAAATLNALVGVDLAGATTPGRLVTGHTNQNAGVLWADVSDEFYDSWLDHEIPFDQVHGHASPWNWQTNQFWPGTPRAIQERCQVQHHLRRTVAQLGPAPSSRTGTATCVDWNLGTSTNHRTWPTLTFSHISIYT